MANPLFRMLGGVLETMLAGTERTGAKTAASTATHATGATTARAATTEAAEAIPSTVGVKPSYSARRAAKSVLGDMKESAIWSEEKARKLEKYKPQARAAAEQEVEKLVQKGKLAKAEKAAKIDEVYSALLEKGPPTSFWKQTLTFKGWSEGWKDLKKSGRAFLNGDFNSFFRFGLNGLSNLGPQLLTNLAEIAVVGGLGFWGVTKYNANERDNRTTALATDFDKALGTKLKDINANIVSALGGNYQAIPVEYKSQRHGEVITSSRYASIVVPGAAGAELEVRPGVSVNETDARARGKNPDALIPVRGQVRVIISEPLKSQDPALRNKALNVIMDTINAGRKPNEQINREFVKNFMNSSRLPSQTLPIDKFDGAVRAEVSKTDKRNILTIEVEKPHAFDLKGQTVIVPDTSKAQASKDSTILSKKPIGSQGGPSLSGPFKF